MKKIIINVFCLFIVCAVFSQDVERIHRFGVRGVYKDDSKEYWGGEFSYQISLEGMRRLEVDLGMLGSMEWDLFQLTGIYQWRLIRKGGFNFYTGPGLGVGYANYGYGDDKFYGVVAANIGVDYTFRLPLQIAVDWRPEYSVLNEINNDMSHQVGLAIRLAF